MKHNKDNDKGNTPTPPTDAYERRKLVVKSVLRTFETLYLDQESCYGKEYLLWIDTNDLIFGGLVQESNNGTLQEELVETLYKNGYDCSIEIRFGVSAGNPTPCAQVEGLDIEMYLEEKKPIIIDDKGTDVPTKARITLALGSRGGLKKSEGYVIEAAHAPYNIGRVIELGDNMARTNHIEIVDETFRVSRTHSHIGFDPNMGFYIQRDSNPKGTNRTKRIRNGVKSELRSINSIMTLQDGDCIELSGQVTLLFKSIGND